LRLKKAKTTYETLDTDVSDDSKDKEEIYKEIIKDKTEMHSVKSIMQDIFQTEFDHDLSELMQLEKEIPSRLSL